ncbi:hypothetical protein C0V77_08850 [Emticicia sp. TH156]|nr:hypothetical protein C0V77_08850 [Emticicia sp. TH156]
MLFLTKIYCNWHYFGIKLSESRPKFFLVLVLLKYFEKFELTKRAKTMLLLTIASLAFGGFLMTRMNEEKEMYAPKGYLASLQSRPRTYSTAW